MIDSIYILSTGGVVLFHHANTPNTRRTTVDTLINEYLLEDRVGDKECIVDELKVRWVVHNNPEFLCVVLYAKTRQMYHLDAFLQRICDVFAKQNGSFIENYQIESMKFDREFKEIATEFETLERSQLRVGGGATESEPLQQPAALAGTKQPASPTAAAASSSGNAAASNSSVFTTKDGRTISKRGAVATTAAAPQASPTKTTNKRTKQATVWDKPPADVAAAQSTSSGPTDDELNQQAEQTRKTFLKMTSDGKVAPVQEREWEGHSNNKRGRLATWLRSYVGARELDQQDFATVIPNLREKLISKNVAVEVAEHVCKSVEASLKGRKIGTFDSLQGAIEESLTEALRRILQPKVEVNILRSVAASVARKKPYSIVLCGVNGVGKSTSLAKIAYWLQQNGHSILIAAGDTFRNGAVEQLAVHGRCLGVPIFEMGYGTDPSAVAAAAVAQAARQKTDVVLIDTAGRMQDHESRMRALAKLIHDNQPDLVLFVGEALVGNNGVDQLRKFNQCLYDFTPVGSKPRGIDGIILTKFDTIDDKVGATLSMVYELGQPIVFVGVGQTYQDLKVIEADVVVSALLQ